MLKNILIITFILFNKTKSTSNCSPNICSSCENLNVRKFFDCVCSDCSKITSSYECRPSECDFCKTFNKKFAFDCICSNCYQNNPGEKSTEEEDRENLGIITAAFITIIIIIIIIFACYCYFKCKKNDNDEGIIRRNNNQVNREYNRNIRIENNNHNYISNDRNLAFNVNNNINSQNNEIISVRKTLALDEILTNENYLGSKICKKEYEKYNIECSICLEKFKEDIDMISITPCFHLFHYKCLVDYFHTNNSAKCPNCNFDIIAYYQNQI